MRTVHDHVGELLVESNCWPQPLGQAHDRVQGWTLVLAVAIFLAIPVAGAIGTSVYDNQVRFYAEEAKHRHAVTATALENSTVDVGPGPADVSFFVRASWTDAGSDHVDVVKWADEATVWRSSRHLGRRQHRRARRSAWHHRVARPAMPWASPSRSGSP